jgi:flagellar hook-length control protein FliK
VAVAAGGISVSQVAGQAVLAAGQKTPQGATPVAGPIQLAATATAAAAPGQVEAAATPAPPAKATKPAPALPGTPADAPTATAAATPDTQHPTPGTSPQSAVSSPQIPVPDPQGNAPAPAAAPTQPQAPVHPTAPNHNPTQQDPGRQAPQQQQNAAALAAPDTQHPTPDTQHPTPDTQHPTPENSPQSAVSGPQGDAPASAAPAIAAPAPAPTAASAQPAPQPAPAAPAAAPQAPVPGMRLAQAVETMHQVIRISQSSGITQARVQLHPEELGQVDIHLRSTPDGVVARVVADASQAAAVLRDGGDDLRRQLAQQGINLTRFDVGTTGQEQRQASFAGGGDQHQRGSRGNTPEDVDSHASVDHNPETTVSLPNGVLIDVLA